MTSPAEDPMFLTILLTQAAAAAGPRSQQHGELAAPACSAKPKSSLGSWLADPGIGTLWTKAAPKKIPARSDVTTQGALSFNL